MQLLAGLLKIGVCFFRRRTGSQLLNDSYDKFVNTDELVVAEIFVDEHVAFSLVVMKIFANRFVFARNERL